MSDQEQQRLLCYRLDQAEKRIDRVEKAILATLIFAAVAVGTTLLKLVGLLTG